MLETVSSHPNGGDIRTVNIKPKPKQFTFPNGFKTLKHTNLLTLYLFNINFLLKVIIFQ